MSRRCRRRSESGDVSLTVVNSRTRPSAPRERRPFRFFQFSLSKLLRSHGSPARAAFHGRLSQTHATLATRRPALATCAALSSRKQCDAPRVAGIRSRSPCRAPDPPSAAEARSFSGQKGPCPLVKQAARAAPRWAVHLQRMPVPRAKLSILMTAVALRQRQQSLHSVLFFAVLCACAPAGPAASQLRGIAVAPNSPGAPDAR